MQLISADAAEVSVTLAKSIGQFDHSRLRGTDEFRGKVGVLARVPGPSHEGGGLSLWNGRDL